VSTLMTETAPNEYEAVFPGFGCGRIVRYWFSAETTTGQTQLWPPGAPAAWFEAVSAEEATVRFGDNFETNMGWTTETLGAIFGFWERGVPVNDPGWPWDPVTDGDGSGQCFLTQNEPGNTDVDEGAVRLTSPVLDLSGGGVMVTYLYFFNLSSTANGVDWLHVEMSDNGLAGPWQTVVIHDTDGGLDWRRHRITRSDIEASGLTLTANMGLRFTANDADPQSVVEAGVDGVEVVRFTCGTATCPADINGDSSVDVLDLLELLASWGQSGVPADVNGDGIVDVLDLLEVLAAWGPCP
jgi:hypothetical protein